ncbi:tripartite tricarboxylate transporter TctB family protein [Halorubrum vacuolatum]|uniref:Tripartite tricarboxylate transporter TctB family protein n=1 Tax=Halorubrum vacuolatum TaxID=63740 RepID=A0A238WJ71_HALVU|nr:tripartite tricarboxylate transporter TctB family protein [Halorubrum vacuolatum]SNR46284.1 Tripartite tricarboxylate transporter TctB family protein [Halorubrum vacuolatum]
MDVQQTYLRVIERISLEHIVLLTMLVSSVYMLWDSFRFGIAPAATFPRMMGSVVLIMTLLLIFRSYLPEPLRSVVADSPDLIDVDEDFAAQEDDEETEEQISVVDRPIHDSLMVGTLIVGFGLLAYAIGIMWASPIFVAVYGLWFRLSWKIILLLVVVSLLIGFGFFEALGLRVDRGEIFLTEGVL